MKKKPTKGSVASIYYSLCLSEISGKNKSRILEKMRFISKEKTEKENASQYFRLHPVYCLLCVYFMPINVKLDFMT